MANKTLLVAQREYLENVRTKTFWIGILAFPVMLLLSFGIGWILSRAKEVKTYAVLDYSAAQIADAVETKARTPDLRKLLTALGQNGDGVLAPLAQAFGGRAPNGADQGADQPLPADVAADMLRRLEQMPKQDLQQVIEQSQAMQTMQRFRRQSLQELGIAGLPREQQEQQLNQLIGKGRLFAYFVIDEKAQDDVKAWQYVSENLTDNDLRQWYADAATQVIQKHRIAEAGVSPEVAKRIQERVTFKERTVGAGGATEDVQQGQKANKWAPVGFVYLLWIAVFTAAQLLLTNTVEEKSNRILEVLLSSVSPQQLMSGKIWGIGATGLTLVGSWVAFALLGVWVAPMLVPSLADFPLMAVIGDPVYLLSFIGYFLTGYLLYAAILVGVGSVCNSLKEAQNLLQPVFLVLIVPLISMMFVTQEPNGTVARVLTYIPLFTPFTMMNRAGGPPPTWEYVASGVLILVSVWLAFKCAAKVFRVGVLMTGKPPKLKEILGWLREK